MSTDTRTPAELKYDLERSGQLYIKPAIDEWIALAREAADLEPGKPAPEPFGALADGTPIMAEFDGVNGQWHRWGCVAVETDQGINIVADDGGYFAFNIGECDLEGVTLAELTSLRDLLNSGAFERMYTASVAWGRGDVEPPTFGDTLGDEIHSYAAGWQAGRSLLIKQVQAFMDTLPSDESEAESAAAEDTAAIAEILEEICGGEPCPGCAEAPAHARFCDQCGARLGGE